jgi:GTPase involved in cell partitioning and DNA repair
MHMSKRDWKLYGRRFRSEITGTAGGLSAAGATIAGVSQGIAAIGLFAATGPVAIAITVGGSALALGGLTAAVFRSVPPKKQSASEFNSRHITLSQLAELHPPVLKLGIVGDTRAGKTTLINRILQKPRPKDRTQGVGAYIAALQTSPVEYVALIDGSGEEFSDQFQIAERADVLVMLLDHNKSATVSQIDPDRISENRDFHRQIRTHLASVREGQSKDAVYILINKRDLWQQEAGEKQRELLNVVDQLAETWRTSALAQKVVVLRHSNLSQDDVSAFLTRITAHKPKEYHAA